MPRQVRGSKIVCYIEETFFNLTVEAANKMDQSTSDYIRDLIVKDLHERGMIEESDFAGVVYNSLNSRIELNAAG